MNKPTIVKKDGFMVVGLKYRGKNEQNEVPQLWQSLRPVADQIRHIVPHGATYGIMDNYDEATGEFEGALCFCHRFDVGVSSPRHFV